MPAVVRAVAPFSFRVTASPIVSTVSSRRSSAEAGSRLSLLPHDRRRRRGTQTWVTSNPCRSQRQ